MRNGANNMEKINSEQVKTAAYELDDLNYQIDFIVGYFNLSSSAVGKGSLNDRVETSYLSLMHDKGLDNISEMSQAINGKVNKASSLLLDVHGIMEEGGLNG